jgi:hypothetical protein
MEVILIFGLSYDLKDPDRFVEARMFTAPGKST